LEGIGRFVVGNSFDVYQRISMHKSCSHQNTIKLATLTKKRLTATFQIWIRGLIKILHLPMIKMLMKLRIEESSLSLLLKDILYSLGEYDKIIKIPFKIKTQT
jgi:hypothetical protein